MQSNAGRQVMSKEVSSFKNCLLHKVVHRNNAKTTHISDVNARQVEAIAANENMPTGIAFGDRYSNTTILDFDTDPSNDREDEYSDHDDQLEDDHSLLSQQSTEEDEEDENESDEESNNNDDGVELQENHFGNADDNDYIGASDDDFVEDADDKESVRTPGMDEAVENPGVDTVEKNRRSSRPKQEPERFADTEHSSVFF